MKKTIYINIKGNAFQIEEDAYSTLNNYLNTIKEKMSNSQEADEIIDDIEIRIAELFRSSCKASSDVVTQALVNEVIKVMGNPKDIAGDDSDSTEKNSADSNNQSNEQSSSSYYYAKKLYRDPDDRVIAGVCGGLGHYFNVQPLIFRILFVVLIFTSITPLVYIAFWIAMPLAETISDRMAMKGAAFNKNSTQGYQRTTYQPTQPMNRPDIVRPISKIFGVLLALASFISLSLLALGAFLYPQFLAEDNTLASYIAKLPAHFIEPSQTLLFGIGLLTVIAIPLLMLLYWGISLVFNVRKGHGPIGVFAFLIWLCGIFIIVYTGIQTGRNFMSVSVVRLEQPLDIRNHKTLYIKPNKTIDYIDDLDIEINDLELISINGIPYFKGNPTIEIHRSNNPRIVFKKHARGKNREDAERNLRNIEYYWTLNDSILQIDKYFTLDDNSLIRNQELDIDIYIPDDVQLEIDRELRWTIRD